MSSIATIAAALAAARRNGRAFTAEPDAGPANAGDAYRIQDAVAADVFRGQRASAWKVGAPRRDVEPTASPIHPPLVVTSPATWTRPPVTGYAIEAEIAFRIARGAAVGADFATCFDQVLVTIEICDARMRNHREVSPLWKLADSQVNAGLVVGGGCAPAGVTDFAGLHCEVRVDGTPVAPAPAGHPLGDPRVLLPWWLRHAAERGGLRAGDVVTTGSWCGLVPVVAGTTVEARFEGVGTASVRFAF